MNARPDTSPAVGVTDHLPRAVVVAVACGVASFLAYSIALGPESITAIWPANAILLAALLTVPKPTWPIYVIVEFFAVLAVGMLVRQDIVVSIGFGVADSIEVVVAAMLIRWRCGDGFDIRRAQNLACFVMAAGILGPILATSIAGAIIAWRLGDVALGTAVVWFAADALGNMIVAPLLLLARTGAFAESIRLGTLTRWTGWLIVVSGTTLAVCLQSRYPLLFLIPLPLIGIAYRLRLVGATVGIAVVAVISLGAAVVDIGPSMLIIGADARERVLILQLLIASAAAVTLTMAVLLDERDRLAAALADARARALAEAEEKAARAVADSIVFERLKDEAVAATAAKSRFIAAASHDMRQPLHAISLFVAALERRVRDPEPARILDSLSRATASLQGMFNSLLDLARLDAGTMVPRIEPVPLGALFLALEAEFAPLAAAKGIKLRVVGTRTVVASDAEMLERILRNLLANAIRYTNRGGVLLGCRRRGRRVVIEVVDSGIGLAPEHGQRIFEEFTRLPQHAKTSPDGLGLGLAIVRRLCLALGATVDVVSDVGKGSRFRVDLGSAAAHRLPARAAPAAAATAPAPSVAGRAVVVDDHDLGREALAAILQEYGLEVVAFATGAGLRAWLADGGRADLVLLDLDLGDGVRGTAMAREVRAALGPDCTIAIVTGSTDANTQAELAMGGHEWLHKPLDPDELEALVRRVAAPSADVV